MISISKVLAKVTRLALDTPPIIYYIESHPTYDSRVTEIFRHVEEGRISGITSVISLTEVLVHPLAKGQLELYLQYQNLLYNSEHIEVVSIDPGIAERAASLRAVYGIRTPDALQIAAAIESGCQAFLTNDVALKRVNGISILVLDEIKA